MGTLGHPERAFSSDLIDLIDLNNPTLPEMRLLKFADQLFGEEEYHRAETEYRRFLSYHPANSHVEHVQLRIFDCYLVRGLLHDALEWGQTVQETYRYRHATSLLMSQRLGDVLLSLDENAKAREKYDLVINSAVDIELLGKAQYSVGYSHLADGDWDSAAAAFLAVPRESSWYEDGRIASSRAYKGAQLPRKNPRVAGLLSIFPGFGYMYVGHTQTGFTSLLLNMLFGAATYSSFAKNPYGLGALFGFVNISFYSGSVYGSVLGASRFNRVTRQEFLNTF